MSRPKETVRFADDLTLPEVQKLREDVKLMWSSCSLKSSEIQTENDSMWVVGARYLGDKVISVVTAKPGLFYEEGLFWFISTSAHSLHRHRLIKIKDNLVRLSVDRLEKAAKDTEIQGVVCVLENKRISVQAAKRLADLELWGVGPSGNTLLYKRF